jgi:hypothetical protein
MYPHVFKSASPTNRTIAYMTDSGFEVKKQKPAYNKVLKIVEDEWA